MTISDAFAYKNGPVSMRVRLIHLPMILRCAAFTFIVMALARPQTQSAWDEKQVEGIDIMLAMDVSTSMLAALMYLLCWGIYLRLKSNKPIKLRVRIVKRILPHQKALSEIEKLKEEKTDGVAVPYDLKGYYTQLTDALRKYIEERFGFNAMEMTSTEIIKELKKEKDQSKIEELTMLFETADLVKFAKYTANFSENDRNLVSAIDFINTTKQENLPTEERIEPSVTEQEKQMQRMRISLKWGLVVLILLSTVLVGYVVYQLWDILN